MKGKHNMMKKYMLRAWYVIDPIYYFFTRLRYVLDYHQNRTIFRVRLTRYKGAPVKLSDGTMINKYDLLLKIHLHNERIIRELEKIDGELKRAVFIYHQIKHAMPSLAYYVHSHHRQEPIKGVIGITSLHRGANRLGFDVIPVKNPIYRLYKKMTFIFIDLIANPQHKSPPCYLMMSKQTLFEKYMYDMLPKVNER